MGGREKEKREGEGRKGGREKYVSSLKKGVLLKNYCLNFNDMLSHILARI